MQVNDATLNALRTSFKAIFQKAFESAQPIYPKIATEVPSSAKSNTYGWMAKIPRLREWVGERVIHNLTEHSYTIENRDFELTIGVDRNDIEDDNLGVYTPLIQSMGMQAKLWPDDLVLEVLKKGKTETGYDGQYFFDTDHPVDLNDPVKGTQSNLFLTTPLTAANYAAVRAAMMAYKGEDGRPLRVNPNLLVVPPQLEGDARQILNAEQISGTTNVYRNTAELLVVPELADEPTVWYLMDTSKPIKPFIFQLRRRPEFQQFTRADDEHVFKHREFLYGVDARGNAGYALWFLAARAEG